MAGNQAKSPTSALDFTNHKFNGEAFGSPTTGGSWPITEKELNHTPRTAAVSARPALRGSNTMPALGRATTQKSVSSVLGFVKISSDPEFAPNGAASKFRSIVSKMRATGYSSASALGEIMQNFPVGLPPLAFPAFGLGLPGGLQTPNTDPNPFLPDIQVKSKRKKRGKTKWKEMRAIIDTGCHGGDLVSLEVVEDLGIKNISFTKEDNQDLQSVRGVLFKACGAVDLSWRGIPKGGVLNFSRNFKTRFLVIDAEGIELPFEILIGSETIWKYNILNAPVLTGGRPAQDRNIIGLPPPPKNKSEKKEPKYVKKDYKTRREENAKNKAAAFAEQNAGHQAAAEGDQGEGDKAEPQPRTQSQNRQVKTPERQSSMHSQHNGYVDKVRSPTNDSNQTGNSDGKRSIHSPPRKAR